MSAAGIRPCESDVGRVVLYWPWPGAQPERGVITRLGSGEMVFVRFAGDLTAKACHVGTLEWEAPE